MEDVYLIERCDKHDDCSVLAMTNTRKMAGYVMRSFIKWLTDEQYRTYTDFGSDIPNGIYNDHEQCIRITKTRMIVDSWL